MGEDIREAGVQLKLAIDALGAAETCGWRVSRHALDGPHNRRYVRPGATIGSPFISTDFEFPVADSSRYDDVLPTWTCPCLWFQ
jgi:hypothetical protein